MSQMGAEGGWHRRGSGTPKQESGRWLCGEEGPRAREQEEQVLGEAAGRAPG